MAQHDYNIANASFPTVRTDINNVLSAINSTNSGSSRPSSAVAGTIWLDTSGAATAQLLKMYDGAADILLGTVNFTANTVDWTDSAITLGANSVDSDQYVDGSIDTIHIGDSQITVGKMATNSVDSDQYVDGSIDTAHIADDQITLAKMASGTDGNIISYDASGNPVAIATGTDGQVLTSTGAGSPPAFETLPASGGKILQVVTATDSTFRSTTSTSFVTGSNTLSVDITPSSTSSKIFIIASATAEGDGTRAYYTIYRDSTNLGTTEGMTENRTNWTPVAISYLDSPSSTSELTYQVYFRSYSGVVYLTNTGKSSITAFEVGV